MLVGKGRCAVSDLQFVAFETAVADRWVIEDEVGRGSRATVYRARAVARGEAVAIKVLRADLASALDSRRFLKQMGMMADVRHPGIVPLLDAGEAAGRLFCLTPFLEGESLRARLERDRQHPLAEALGIARQVADALNRLLAKAPAARFSDAAHLVEALSGLT
jgi:serine/threonine protein kinase